MTPSARRLPILFSLSLLCGLLWSGITAGPAAAVTGAQLEAQLVGWVNRDRTARGLRPLRTDLRLADLAGDRARILAQRGVLSHTVPGNIASQLNGRRIQWYRYGEVIAYASGWGSSTASAIFNLWKRSSGHWSLLMSNRLNYLGAGLAYRSSGRTFASIVLTESLDHTWPRAAMEGVSRSGTSLNWSWSGYDPLLQTHTAGLRNFDVQYRVDSGAWRALYNGTRGTGLTLANRVRGHSYAIRVRSRDNRGLIGRWTPELRAGIP
jgi:hypothetical protein